MRKMTLQEIQSVNLELMKDIHAFCVKNDIKYSLAYGSLIGAIRHKGFIPWDDDIDIMMPRPDYEKFSSSYVSPSGYTLTSIYDKESYINYTRVYDNNTLVIPPAKPGKRNVGVWVDVYPIDGVPDSEKEVRDQFSRIRKYTRRIMKLRFLYHRWNSGPFSAKIKAGMKILAYTIMYEGNIQKWRNELNSICKEKCFGETIHCSSLLCMEANRDNKQEIFKTVDFQGYKLVAFEDQEFYVATGYDNILRQIFGNYMKMPPKDKQVSHIIHKWKFYWK